MLTTIIPKLPMRNKDITLEYYTMLLKFEVIADYGDYLLLGKDNIEIHFFAFETLDIAQNYGQVYIRVDDIKTYYNDLLSHKVTIHPNAPLQTKPWGQTEFSLLDPDNNLLTFGQKT